MKLPFKSCIRGTDITRLFILGIVILILCRIHIGSFFVCFVCVCSINQLECRIKMGDRYLYPHFEMLHWYAAGHIAAESERE